MQADILDRITSNSNAWDTCPTELLLMILGYFNVRTDAQTLLNCLAVNRRWWDVVSSLIEHRIGLDDFLKLAQSDHGSSFKKRTALRSISDLLMNLSLWKDIHVTVEIGHFNYDLIEVINDNVYKDQIIVVTDRDVRYFNVENHMLIKILPIQCSNFDENEFMFVKMDHNNLEDMTLHGKLTEHSCVDERFKYTTKISFYRMYDNCCYFTTHKLHYMYVARWEQSKWKIESVGRYYGHGVITDVIFDHDDIVGLLNWGGLLLADSETRPTKLKLISQKKTSVIFELPVYASKSILYHRYGAIATVPSCYPLKLSHKGIYWILECPDLTCSLKHANMLLLGYKNGKVEIYNPELFLREMHDLKPEVTLRVQDLAADYEQFDSSVRHLEVIEVKGAHVLIIATSVYVHQVTLDHRL